MLHFRDIFENHLPGDKSYKCAVWAFGDGFESLYLDEIMDAWNRLHGDIFMLLGDGDIKVDIPRIIEAWEERT